MVVRALTEPGRDSRVDGDHRLVQSAKAGDPVAVEALVRRYQVRIYNYARALTASDADAEDLAQETFVRAFRGIDRFRGDSSFKNWMYRIATNVVRTHQGRRARQGPVWDERTDDHEGAGDQDPSHVVDVETAVIQRDALDRALATLSEELRVPVVLHDVEGLEYREIATVVDVPVGTVMSRIYRARQKLRARLAAWRPRRLMTERVEPDDHRNRSEPVGRPKVRRVAL